MLSFQVSFLTENISWYLSTAENLMCLVIIWLTTALLSSLLAFSIDLGFNLLVLCE